MKITVVGFTKKQAKPEKEVSSGGQRYVDQRAGLTMDLLRSAVDALKDDSGLERWQEDVVKPFLDAGGWNQKVPKEFFEKGLP